MDFLKYFVPEILLIVGIFGMLISELTYKNERFRLTSLIAGFGFSAAMLETLILFRRPTVGLFQNTISIDGLSIFFKFSLLLICLLAIVLIGFQDKEDQKSKVDQLLFLLFFALSGCLFISASDLIVMWIALMLIIISSFFGYATSKGMQFSEGAFKLTIFGVLSSVSFLIGTFSLYYLTGTFTLDGIHQYMLAHTVTNPFATLSFLSFLTSVCILCGAAPFYFWQADSVEGSPTPTSYLVLLGIPVIGFSMAIRMFSLVFSEPIRETMRFFPVMEIDWQFVIVVVVGFTMLLGSLMALRQKRLKRKLAFLVMSQIGFILISLVTLVPEGVAGALFQILVFIPALMGALLITMGVDQRVSDLGEETYRGLSWSNPRVGLALMFFLATLVGFPPLPAFFGWFSLLDSAVQQGWMGITLVAIISQLINFATVAKVFYLMTRKTPELKINELNLSNKRLGWTLTSLCLPLILMTLFAQPILMWARNSFRIHLW